MPARHVLASALFAAVLASGCNHWKAPEKVAELEKRVDELSDVVSAMKGKPVGKRPGAATEHEEEEEAAADGEDADVEGDAGEAEHGKDEKAEKDDEKPGFGKKKGDDAAAEAEARPADAKAKVSDKKGKAEVDPVAVAAHKALGHAHWGYSGKAGPAHWGELEDGYAACAEGQEQSPIDVVPPGGKRASDIVFVYQPTKARVVDNGHTLQVSFDPGNTIFIDGHRYDLLQMHMHTPSEHTLAGERYALELHFVHKDAEGKLAVVAVLYDEGPPSSLMDSVYKRWPSKVGSEKSLGKLDITQLLPENRGVFRYQGSLTTPPCSEGVVWNVMRRTRTDSPAHLALFRKHYPDNARPVQALKGREIK